MKKKMKLTSLNEKGIEKLEVEKLQKIRGGGTCSNADGSCTTKQTFHESFSTKDPV